MTTRYLMAKELMKIAFVTGENVISRFTSIARIVFLNKFFINLFKREKAMPFLWFFYLFTL